MSSTSIYISDFIPVYIYIKQHSITGKLYFGKTTLTNIEQYNGSGKYWLKHIKKHGKEHIITLWYCIFYDKESIVKFAESFCKLHIIGYGDTTIWANLRPENGLDGGCPGEIRPSSVGMAISKAKKGIPQLQIIADTNKLVQTKLVQEGKHHFQSAEHKLKISKLHKGKKQPIVICPYCNKSGGNRAMKQWHFDNCKLKVPA